MLRGTIKRFWMWWGGLGELTLSLGVLDTSYTFQHCFYTLNRIINFLNIECIDPPEKNIIEHDSKLIKPMKAQSDSCLHIRRSQYLTLVQSFSKREDSDSLVPTLAVVVWWHSSSEWTPQSIRTDFRGGASCMRRWMVMVSSKHLTSGLSGWTRNPLCIRSLFLLTRRHTRMIRNIDTLGTQHWTVMFSFISWLFCDVRSLSASVHVLYPSHYLSQCIWSSSLLPVCGLSVSASAAVMFIFSESPPPFCTQGFVRSFVWQWGAGFWILPEINDKKSAFRFF